MEREWLQLAAAIGAAGGALLDAGEPVKRGPRPVWAAVGEPGPRDRQGPRRPRDPEEGVTGVVDWDDFALNSRAADLGTVLFEWYRLALAGHARLAHRGRERVTGRIVEIAGEAGLRCIVAYAAVARLAVSARRRHWTALERWTQVTDAALGDLGG